MTKTRTLLVLLGLLFIGQGAGAQESEQIDNSYITLPSGKKIPKNTTISHAKSDKLKSTLTHASSALTVTTVSPQSSLYKGDKLEGKMGVAPSITFSSGK